MKTTTDIVLPRIETLLLAAHRDRDALLKRRNALAIRGIDRDHLPDDVVVMAFALLGDHERDRLIAQLKNHWDALQSRGLAYGAINSATTAELRLLEHVREHVMAIGTVLHQLRETAAALPPPREIWRRTEPQCGIWGQMTQIDFSVQGASHLLIDPDPIFGLQHAVLAANPEHLYSGSFHVPIDNGDITISLLYRSGEIYRDVVRIAVEELY
ncbi:MAG: hypothetical protein ACREXT_16850 [Gammaproteobacteria bacterium]